MIKPWTRSHHKLLSSSRIMDFRQACDLSPYSGKQHDFVYLDSTDWVNIVAITANQELLMIKQFRHGNQSISLEIPGGMVDKGESAVEAAARECLEETGYRADKLQSIGNISPNPAIHNNLLHCFISQDIEFIGSDFTSATEKTEVCLVPLTKIKAMLMSGEINHALVCASLWRVINTMKL